MIVGGGQAGFQVAVSLRDHGWAAPIAIVDDGDRLPYSRPPLSKEYLHDPEPADLSLRPQAFYDRAGIELRLGQRADRIVPGEQAVVLADGTRLEYDHLVLATGSSPRRLALPGADLAGVVTLRDHADAAHLRERLAAAPRVVIVGGGFIGCEIAAAAVRAGGTVTILEAAERLMQRVVSPPVSEYALGQHVAHGVVVRLGAAVTALEGAEGRVAAVVLAGGERIAADLVLIAVGVIPAAGLAEAAGLEVADGIVVDADLRTSDPRISALGDCASFPSPHAGGVIRLESVQNAVDQAKHIAARIAGSASGQAYAATPWFWTHQYDDTIQIAGIGLPGDEFVVAPGATAAKFSVYRFRGGRLAAVESVNSPRDHRRARTLVAEAPSETEVAGILAG